ncbi:MAG: tRNA-dihydrouridine synthase family protein, partial [Bacilli bacterium]|nr:tRNA-dihydrouridine synthase family protein [Bacilli bacterium]
MKIADIEIKTPVILAPMAGVTTLAYREFMKPFGVGLSYSEMISDCGLVYGNALTREYAKTSKIDHPVGLQLFGNDPAIAKKAIAILEGIASYDILDVNLGCPVYKVTKTGAGSAMLKDPNTLYTYMREVVSSSHKPVSAKIRLGWDSQSINVREVASLLEKTGVSLISIH